MNGYIRKTVLDNNTQQHENYKEGKLNGHNAKINMSHKYIHDELYFEMELPLSATYNIQE